MAVPASAVNPLVRVVSPDELVAAERRREEQMANKAIEQEQPTSELAAYVRQRVEMMRNYRETEGINARLLRGLRAYRGEYDEEKKQQIAQFNGSSVYARITATKCRAATSLLRDVYLGPEKPWAIEPTPDPVVPEEIQDSIAMLVTTEVTTAMEAGEPLDESTVRDRLRQLNEAAEMAAREQARKQAEQVERRIEDALVEGGFYQALSEFLADLPIFPYAVLKGPIIKQRPQMKWVNGRLERVSVAKPYWQRVSPFDFYWSPMASDPSQSEFGERVELRRADLAAMKGMPGVDDKAIEEILSIYHQRGNYRWWDGTEFERMNLESKDKTFQRHYDFIDTIVYVGTISGQLLLDWGYKRFKLEPTADYYVTAWLIDRWVVQVQISPFNFQPAPYYVGRYVEVPGSFAGESLADVLHDIQEVSNAALRALVNNLAISSGPQVAINDGAISSAEDDQLYPWKRWHYNVDPSLLSTAQRPIDFFQPQSNAQDLLSVYTQFSVLADEVSALPRYMTGNEKVGGAGRTASGLAMLMSNAAKTLQNVAAGIDRTVIGPVLRNFYDYLMLTDPENYRGDEQIVTRGVQNAVKREQDRMRQLEFLQITANPIDVQVVGPQARAKILANVAKGLGIEGVVPENAPAAINLGAGMPSAPAPGAVRAGPEAVREPIEGMV